MLYLIRFLVFTGRLPRFSSPVRLSDKLALRILSNRCSQRRQRLADKLQAGAIAGAICPNLRIKQVHAIYDRAEQLSLAELPQAFVLKPNNASGMTVLVLDKSAVPEEQLRAIIAPWFDLDYYHVTQEPSYRGIKARVFAEELTLGADGFFPFEYRLFCFHGRVEFLQCDFNTTEPDGSFFVDRDWKLIEAWHEDEKPAAVMPRRATLERAIAAAERLAEGFDFIRVDLYDLNLNEPDSNGSAGREEDGQLVFGELTSSPWGGLVRLEPAGADETLGAYWKPYSAREPVSEHEASVD